MAAKHPHSSVIDVKIVNTIHVNTYHWNVISTWNVCKRTKTNMTEGLLLSHCLLSWPPHPLPYMFALKHPHPMDFDYLVNHKSSKKWVLGKYCSGGYCDNTKNHKDIWHVASLLMLFYISVSLVRCYGSVLIMLFVKGLLATDNIVFNIFGNNLVRYCYSLILR